MKKLIAWILCCLMACCCLCASAESAYTVRVEDEADLLSGYEEQKLAEQMTALTAYGDAVFWSTKRAGVADTLAEMYFDDTISSQPGYNGVIFMVDMNTREILIFTRGVFEKRVGSIGAYGITDNIYSLASQRRYYDCAAEGFAQVLRLMEGQRVFSPMRVICSLLLSLSLGLIAAYLMIRRTTVMRVNAQNQAPTGETKVNMAIVDKRLIKSHRSARSSGGGGVHGGFGGGGGSRGGGFSGGGGSSGSHRF